MKQRLKPAKPENRRKARFAEWQDDGNSMLSCQCGGPARSSRLALPCSIRRVPRHDRERLRTACRHRTWSGKPAATEDRRRLAGGEQCFPDNIHARTKSAGVSMLSTVTGSTSGPRNCGHLDSARTRRVRARANSEAMTVFTCPVQEPACGPTSGNRERPGTLNHFWRTCEVLDPSRGAIFNPEGRSSEPPSDESKPFQVR